MLVWRVVHFYQEYARANLTISKKGTPCVIEASSQKFSRSQHWPVGCCWQVVEMTAKTARMPKAMLDQPPLDLLFRKAPSLSLRMQPMAKISLKHFLSPFLTPRMMRW